MENNVVNLKAYKTKILHEEVLQEKFREVTQQEVMEMANELYEVIHGARLECEKTSRELTEADIIQINKQNWGE